MKVPMAASGGPLSPGAASQPAASLTSPLPVLSGVQVWLESKRS